MTAFSEKRIFLLSPASCSGRRAEILLREEADFDLAKRLREGNGVPLGEVFTFLSGLYFRGKLAYASRFGSAPANIPKALVITAGKGLLSPETLITRDDIVSFTAVPIDHREPQFREPLVRDTSRLLAQTDGDSPFILLGSIATPKYRDILTEVLGDRLHFPVDFIGRGDMSRGGLMLRCVEANEELTYSVVHGSAFRGARPPKLQPRISSAVER